MQRSRQTEPAYALPIFLVLINILGFWPLSWRLLAWVNRRFGWFAGIFVSYPASQQYLRSYSLGLFSRWLDWQPWLIGVIREGRHWTLHIGVSATERELLADANTERLSHLANQLDQMRKTMGASHLRLAGILPSVLQRRGLGDWRSAAAVTVSAVLFAVDKVRENHGLNDSPIILLGGAGFIGRGVLDALSAGDIHVVDPKGGQGWPADLVGKPALLVNLSRAGVLARSIDRLWPELVVLNEVYPEPGADVCESLKRLGITVYHLAGLSGWAWPSFPQAYRGAIPCCAGLNADIDNVELRRLA